MEIGGYMVKKILDHVKQIRYYTPFVSSVFASLRAKMYREMSKNYPSIQSLISFAITRGERKEKKHSRCLLFLATLLGSTIAINAEYLVYKEIRSEDGAPTMTPLTESEHAIVYPILMRYQFPMSLCHDLEKELHPTEFAQLAASEEEFIRHQIETEIKRGTLPVGTKIAFIPNTLYELLFLHTYIENLVQSYFFSPFHNVPKKGTTHAPSYCFYQKDCRGEKHYNTLRSSYDYEYHYDQHNFDYGMGHLNQAYLRSLKETFPDAQHKNYFDEATYLACIYKLIRLPIMQQYHHKTQTALIKLLQSVENLTPVGCNNLVTNYTHKLQSLFTKNIPRDREKRDINVPSILEHINHSRIPMLQHIIREEAKAHDMGNWLLFRGTNPRSSTRLNSTLINNNPHSVSYGNYLFSGSIFDKVLGCPFDFICESTIGYVVSITKADYMKNNKIRALFFIQSLPSFLSACATGEDYHPRTKIFALPDGIEQIAGHDFYFELPCNYLLTNHSYFSSAQQLENYFQEYLQRHHVIIHRKEPLLTTLLKTYSVLFGALGTVCFGILKKPYHAALAAGAGLLLNQGASRISRWWYKIP